MADLGFDYDAEQYQPLENFEPVPAGDYEAQIVESETKPTKKGDGELLNLKWRIIGGEYDGRYVFDRVNLKNPTAKAVEIGMRQLSSICHAIGKLRVADSAELHDTPCTISVKVRPAGPDNNGVHREASNEIKNYAALQASAPVAAVGRIAAPAGAPAPAAARPAAARTAPAVPTKKPWER